MTHESCNVSHASWLMRRAMLVIHHESWVVQYQSMFHYVSESSTVSSPWRSKQKKTDIVHGWSTKSCGLSFARRESWIWSIILSRESCMSHAWVNHFHSYIEHRGSKFVERDDSRIVHLELCILSCASWVDHNGLTRAGFTMGQMGELPGAHTNCTKLGAPCTTRTTKLICSKLLIFVMWQLQVFCVWWICVSETELSPGHFSWTRPDPANRWPDPTRPDPTRPTIADKKSDPTRPAARICPYVYSL